MRDWLHFLSWEQEVISFSFVCFRIRWLQQIALIVLGCTIPDRYFILIVFIIGYFQVCSSFVFYVLARRHVFPGSEWFFISLILVFKFLSVAFLLFVLYIIRYLCTNADVYFGLFVFNLVTRFGWDFLADRRCYFCILGLLLLVKLLLYSCYLLFVNFFDNWKYFFTELSFCFDICAVFRWSWLFGFIWLWWNRHDMLLGLAPHWVLVGVELELILLAALVFSKQVRDVWYRIFIWIITLFVFIVLYIFLMVVTIVEIRTTEILVAFRAWKYLKLHPNHPEDLFPSCAFIFAQVYQIFTNVKVFLSLMGCLLFHLRQI